MNSFNFIADGAKGLFRNGFRSVASIIILASSLLLVGIFSTLMVIINQSVENIDDFNYIVVYMNIDADEDDVSNAGKAIQGLKNVKNITFISKAEALESEKEKFEDYSYIFDSYDDTTNPLPDTFKIEYERIEDIDALVYNLEHLDLDGDGKSDGVIDKDGDGKSDGVFDKIKNRYDIAKNIQNFKSAISLGGTWLMILLVAVSVFVISNTIRLTYHSRELEITVMRYIGATKTYITLPFVFEGALVGAISGILGYIIQYYLYAVPLAELSDKFDGFIVIPEFSFMNNYYLPIFFVAGILLGVVGSALAIRKYMKA